MEDTQRKVVKPLTVYKASAGSGKTFTLAAEYIKLLINDTRAYEHILAVTFTNKATEEMKSRILSQLYGIANGLTDSDDYLEKICKELNLKEDYVRKRAAEALTNLLHNYNFFRVQTIDTFFQGVMRNLAKELSLSNNLRISLNDKAVIGQAVDSMMETMVSDKQLLRWVEEYVEDCMDNEKTWNVADDIKSFGGNLTKEFFKTNRPSLDKVFSDPDFFPQYKRQLSSMLSSIEKRYATYGEQFTQALNASGLSIDDFFYGKSGPIGYFLRLANGAFYDKAIIGARLLTALADDSKWAKSKSKNTDSTINFALSVLVPLYNKVEKTRSADVILYESAKKTVANINKLRLLHSIEEEILRQNGEHSRFMLSNTQSLLSSMIGSDDKVAPFIFEKIGSRITHIMIDEFQDTSKVQWKNFKVLLEECMSSPVFSEDTPEVITNNLIVGDVKQSIYRFRSGEWRLLNNIDDPDTGFASQRVDITSLQTNFRSERNIIDFNNLFFKAAASLEADRIMPEDENEAEAYIASEGFSDTTAKEKRSWSSQLRKAYGDVCQLVPKKRLSQGQVKIKLIGGGEDKETVNNEVMEYAIDNINRLLHDGVKQKNIAILVRQNKSIPVIAEYFSNHAPHLHLVSEEAFRLDSSIAVTMIIAGMRLLSRPNDKESRATLAKYYTSFSNDDAQASGIKCDSMIFINKDELSSFLPPIFADGSKRQKMLSMPLSELTELFMREFRLNDIDGQTIYISTFFDKLNAYVGDNGGVLEDFLTYWDEELRSKTVSVSNIDGIRIMSMHKSKGLEFDHVIIPFCNWHLLPPHPETLWCSAKEEPFSELPYIPIDYSNENTFKNTIYELDGCEEAMQEIVDNLNTLYVAFTRAGKSLIVVGDITKPAKGKMYNEDYRSTLIYKTINNIYNSLNKLLETEEYKANPNNELHLETDENTLSLELSFGSLAIRKEEDKDTKNVFLAPSTNIDIAARSYENKAVQFRQSNKSRDFANDVDEDDDMHRFIHNGTILHQLFSSINSIDDVDRVLREMEFEGIVYNEDTTPAQLRAKLAQKFRNPQVSEWFAPRWEVFNECAILHTDSSGKVVEERPDRVITDGTKTIVIDYKFGSPHDGYTEQVQSYMQLLTDMGMPNVEGYIWYVSRNVVDEVKLEN